MRPSGRCLVNEGGRLLDPCLWDLTCRLDRRYPSKVMGYSPGPVRNCWTHLAPARLDPMTRPVFVSRSHRVGAWMARAFLVLLLTGCGGFWESDGSFRYMAVIDAGSSGSRIFLYERTWAGSELRVQQLFTDTGGQALSNFAGDPAAAGPQGVQPLLDKLTTRLDQLGLTRDQVQVNLLATAGMRLVDESAAALIYGSARNTIVASGLRPGRVETLTGQYEGIYAWVDVNNLAGRLSAGASEPLGIVEVGGASAQVAFLSTAEDSRVASVWVHGQRYRVFSVSWLGLGQDQARLAMINGSGAGAGTSNNACFANNAAGVGGASFDAGVGGLSITSGSYNFSQCSGLYADALASFNVGAVRTVPGFADAPLVAVSSASLALSNWRASNDTNQLSVNLAAQCAGFNAYGNQVVSFLGQDPASKFTQNACANGTYANALMFGNQGLGLAAGRINDYATLGIASSTWTRGFALTAL